MVEYEIVVTTHSKTPGSGIPMQPGGTVRLHLPGDGHIAHAQRVFNEIAGTWPSTGSGNLRLLGWTGADHSRAFGLILQERTWGQQPDADD